MTESQEADQPTSPSGTSILQALISEREKLIGDNAKKDFIRRIIDLGQNSLALETCNDILVRLPNDFDTQLMRVRARLQPGLTRLDIELFAAELDKLVVGKNLEPTTWLTVAKLYQTMGKLASAIKIMKRVETLGDNSVQTARHIIFLMIFKGDYYRACGRLRRFLRRNDVPSLSMHEFSELALKCGRPRLAIALERKRLQDNPNDINAIVGLSLFLARANKLRKAQEIITPFIQRIAHCRQPAIIIEASEALGRVGMFDARHLILSEAAGALPDSPEIAEALRSAQYAIGSTLGKR